MQMQRGTSTIPSLIALGMQPPAQFDDETKHSYGPYESDCEDDNSCDHVYVPYMEDVFDSGDIYTNLLYEGVRALEDMGDPSARAAKNALLTIFQIQYSPAQYSESPRYRELFVQYLRAARDVPEEYGSFLAVLDEANEFLKSKDRVFFEEVQGEVAG